jgi:hypothetical protein
VLSRRMREWLQDLLDAEVDELLGRPKSARRKLGWAIRYNGSSPRSLGPSTPSRRSGRATHNP